MDSRLNVERQNLFNLKWNYNSLTISTAFYKFYKAKKFTDMSLICQNRTINCHKLVLYTGSGYFEEQLIKHDGSCQPQFDLAGISFSAMKKVLKFIYKGEVIFGRPEMDEFLQTVQQLKVKGLFNEIEGLNVPPLPAPRHSSSNPLNRRRNYTKTELMSALQDVQNGMTISASARVHGIPFTTLSDNLKKRGIRPSFQRPRKGWINKNRKYTKEDLDAAIQDVRSGIIDGNTAAKSRNISRTTLFDNCTRLGIPFTCMVRNRKGTLRSRWNTDFANQE